MHALEMEEVEPFVGEPQDARSSKKKKATAGIGTNGGSVTASTMSSATKPAIGVGGTSRNNLRLVLCALIVCLAIVVYTFGFAQPSAQQQQQQQNNELDAEGGSSGSSSLDGVVNGNSDHGSSAGISNNNHDNNNNNNNHAETTTDSDSGKASKDEEEKKEEMEMVYSKIAKVIPDPEHAPISEEFQKSLQATWGRWHFWDGDEKTRPSNDYCAKFPNRDIFGEDFPENAWQTDAVFVNHILDDGEKLVSRAKEAIFTEYGHPKEGMTPDQLGERIKMLYWTKIDMSKPEAKVPDKYSKKGDAGAGGYTTTKSFQGLTRRLLHAMVTNDEFTVVLAGHSSAAGHGNHFRQSYAMQFHRIMAPILARFGVKLITKNYSQGGLGTLQGALGSASIYGSNIDLLLWDSGMTEPALEHFDLFCRQALMSSGKVPVIWGGYYQVLRDLSNRASVDVGYFGRGTDVLPVTTSKEQAETLPYAARYMKCGADAAAVCKEANPYCATCWIPRDDLDPHKLFASIATAFPSQVKWHPGWRQHMLQGHVIAYAVLDAMQNAIQIYSDGTMSGPPLDEEYWHVTEYYNKIRSKIKDWQDGHCARIEGIPKRVCWTPLKGATHHTPRNEPDKTSISALVKPAPNGYKPVNTEKEMYHGPDVHNPCFDVPEGGVDVVAIVSGRKLLELGESEPVQQQQQPELSDHDERVFDVYRNLGPNDIVPGLGWQVVGEPPGLCDGAYHSICGRSHDNPCPLAGHHDGRGAISGNGYSGWLVMELPDVSAGIIILKLFSAMNPDVNTVTAGWTSVNNGGRFLRQSSNKQHRNFQEMHVADPPASQSFVNSTTDESTVDVEDYDGLYLYDDDFRAAEEEAYDRWLADAENLPESFSFEFAIDGKITSWNKKEYIEHRKSPQRVVQLWTILDDENFTSEPKKVELAIRVQGCGRECTIGLSHIYWA